MWRIAITPTVVVSGDHSQSEDLLASIRDWTRRALPDRKSSNRRGKVDSCAPKVFSRRPQVQYLRVTSAAATSTDVGWKELQVQFDREVCSAVLPAHISELEIGLNEPWGTRRIAVLRSGRHPVGDGE